MTDTSASCGNWAAFITGGTVAGVSDGQAAPSNLSMATSKPAAGMLSTGQRYLVCTTAKNDGGKRTPLTIAV